MQRLTTLLLALLAFAGAYAQYESPDITGVEELKGTDDWLVRFFSLDDFTTIEKYNVYMAEDLTDDRSKFTKVQTKEITASFADTLKWSMQQQRSAWLKGKAPAKAFEGKRSYYIETVYKNNNGTLDGKIYKKNWDSGNTQFSIDLTYDKITQVDEEHTTTIKSLPADMEVDVEFHVNEGDATYDAQTKKITFTPEDVASYTFTATFSDKNNPQKKITLQWGVTAGECADRPYSLTFWSQDGLKRVPPVSIQGVPVDSTYPSSLIEIIGKQPNYFHYRVYQGDVEFYLQSTIFDPFDRTQKTVYVAKDGDMMHFVPEKIDAHVFVSRCWEADTFEIEERPELSIVSYPDRYAKVNEEYVYEPKVEDASSNLTWSLLEGPIEAEIDETTGKVTYTPTEFSETGDNARLFEIKVLDNQTNFSATQAWTTYVSPCDTSSTLFVELQNKGFRFDKDVTLTIYTEKGEEMQSVRMKNGMALFSVYGNEYYLSIDFHEGDLSRRLWYGNVYNFADAESVEGPCNSSSRLSWDITDFQPEFIAINGWARDYDTKDFIDADMQLVSVGGGLAGMETKIKRSFGQFGRSAEFIVESGSEFVLRAYSTDSTGNSNYYPLGYHEDSESFMTADIIYGNQSGEYDVLLRSADPYEAEVFGAVVDQQGNPIENAFIVFYLVEDPSANEAFKYKGFNANLAGPGVYTAAGVEGKYVGYIFSRGYIAGFWNGNGNKLSPRWEDAQRIELIAGQAVGDFNFQLEPMPPRMGMGTLSGNTKKRGGLIKMVDNKDAAAEANGVIISMLNSNNDIIASTYSDREGDFMMEGMEEGQYTLVANKPGFTTATKQIILSPGNMEQDIEIQLDVNSVLSEANTTDAYPNPAQSEVTISLDANSENVTSVTAVDAKGTEVQLNWNQSANGITVSVDALAVGSYHILVNTGNGYTISPIVKK
ncbi:MAG: hypothetical protein Kapaf2KO_11030 [Candidatus Kapaibacteriales bacterium]